ncbi:MAG: DegT/DnrJ/EryC1/StrS family aminotransferase [Candidatus Calescibacterium sp.]|nr:DegT/DnrJ/EryC1/StrS family aminotransferase [Candidatus Calescibacterium sp.]MCX7758399.1 DegT/DnrJ/EryC1/StrS family aminotransferase [bacterium]MDW8195893.1 DegT/DnrJ/EryC1/StrS family aminotransferase [Candidatus Calescibacterium sp.]
MLNIGTKVYLDNPNIGELEKKYVIDALESGFISTRGHLIKIFEEKLGEYLGGYVSATYCGTAGLHLSILYSMKKNKIKERVGVILPALTFAATAHAVLYNNLIPVFVDVEYETWNIDISKVDDLIKICRSRGIDIKFIIPVHLYGNPVDMDEIRAISTEYELIVIEDSAEALGSYYKGKKCGTLSDFGVFSFNANKVITASSGGAIFSTSKEDIEYIRFLTLQARNESKGYYHEDMGFNYRMTNIEAAIVLAQLEKLDYFLMLKREFFKIYTHYLSDYVEFQKIKDYNISNYWLISCLFRNLDIPDLQKKLEQYGIPTRRIFYPLPLMDFYRDFTKIYLDNANPIDFYRNAFEIYSRGLCLPSSTKNTTDTIELVAKTILDVIKK